MFPLRDENPSYQVPIVVIALIVANVAVFLWEMAAPDLQALFQQYALIPAVATGTGQASGNIGWTAVFTSMFMHASWFHLLGNMWFLWLFGDNIEWVMGRGRFLVFYFLCGIGAALAQVFLSPGAEVPMVGASGAIAGVLAIYMITYPTTRVLTLITLFYYIRVVPIPAVVWIGIWLLLQILGAGVSVATAAVGGVAYAAHIGGFITGIVLGIPLRYRERVVHAPAGRAGGTARRGLSLHDEIERQRYDKGLTGAPSYGVPYLDTLIRSRKYDDAKASASTMLDEALRSGNRRMADIYRKYVQLIETLG